MLCLYHRVHELRWNVRDIHETQSLKYQKITVVLSSSCTLLYTQTSPIESSGIPPGLSFCPKEYHSCPTSPSDRAAIRVAHDSPKVGTARSMRKRLQRPTNATSGIPAPTSATAPPGGRLAVSSSPSIHSASCVAGREDLHERRLPIISRPLDMVVLMMRRTSWHYATGATRPSTGVKRTDGKGKRLLLVVYPLGDCQSLHHM